MPISIAGAAYLGADPRTLAQQQADCLAAITKAKNAALAVMQYATGGATYAVTLGTQDQLDVQTQLSILQAQPSGATISWEIVNGVFLTWAVSDLQALQQAGIAHVLGCYSNAARLTAAANAATSADQLPDPNSGWPA